MNALTERIRAAAEERKLRHAGEPALTMEAVPPQDTPPGPARETPEPAGPTGPTGPVTTDGLPKPRLVPALTHHLVLLVGVPVDTDEMTPEDANVIADAVYQRLAPVLGPVQVDVLPADE
jgi:hypothetical protein